MDEENIGLEYKKEMDDAKNKFLDGMQSKNDINLLEKTYKDDLIKAREKYYSRTIKNLKQRKFKETNSQLKKDNDEKKSQKPFKVEKYKLKLSLKDGVRFKKEILFFKLKFKLKNFFENPHLHHISYFITKIKFKILILAIKTKNIIQKLFSWVKDKRSIFIKLSMEKVIKLFNKIKNIIKNVKERGLLLFRKKADNSNN